ncbi:Fic family protein [Companilactobacillus sp. HBUAS59544]|uniref:Fic family protein n=1 Tax=Companilactobacillus sp. HBUAS59544 TaxID=3109363 RepID=UPI002FF2801F
MTLKPLSILSYMSSKDNSIDVKAEYDRRLNSESSFKTSLFPVLTDKNGHQSDVLPIFFIEDRNLVISSNKIQNNSRKIIQLSHELPGIAQNSYIQSLLTDEIQFSNEIEGVKTDRKEIGTIVDNLQNNNTPSQRRLVSTVKKYLDILNEPVIRINNFEDLRNLYDNLTAGEILAEKLPDGEFFRDSSVRIGNSTQTVHRPPVDEKKIKEKLYSLIDFMNNDDIPPIEKSLVTHFMFENTHPFNYGNGRMGRYLLSQYLSKKIDSFTALSISSSIHENQNKYYKMFKDADKFENYAELTFFIGQMMNLIIEGQESVLENMSRLLSTLNQARDRLKQDLDFADEENIEFEVLMIFVQSKLFSVDSSLGIKDTDLINLLYNQNTKKYKKIKVKGIIEKYEKLGILEKINGKPLQHEIRIQL